MLLHPLVPEGSQKSRAVSYSGDSMSKRSPCLEHGDLCACGGEDQGLSADRRPQRLLEEGSRAVLQSKSSSASEQEKGLPGMQGGAAFA